jgi:hypothetical protein
MIMNFRVNLCCFNIVKCTNAFLLIALLCLGEQALSQRDEITLRKLLERYDDYESGLMTHDSLQKYSPDKYLVKILKCRRIEQSENFPNLGIKYSPDKKLALYSYHYWTHGSSLDGFFYVVQWAKADGTFDALALYPYLEKTGLSDFVSFWRPIIQLNSPDKLLLYLLVGEQGHTSFHYKEHEFQVIQVKDDKLELNYPAFFGKSLLRFYDRLESYDSLCENDRQKSEEDSSLQNLYDQKTQTLMIGCFGDDDKLNSITAAELFATYRKRRIQFKWNGKAFVLN